jgi:hypothetical protein
MAINKLTVIAVIAATDKIQRKCGAGRGRGHARYCSAILATLAVP